MDWIVLDAASRMSIRSVGLVRGWGFRAVMDLRALRAERRPLLREVVLLDGLGGHSNKISDKIIVGQEDF
jgi:hypothetical protein